MITDNFYMHTFSIRELHVQPVVHTVLLTVHTEGGIKYIASAALVGFWEVYRGYIIFLRCQVSLFPLFLFILFQLHKTSHVASKFGKNAYITDQHGQYKFPSFYGTFSLC